jgi:hypothetical protein
MTQIRVTKQSKYNFKYEYQGAVAEMPTLATTDKALFKAIRDKYSKEICGFWRRWFSLKTLKRLRLLSVLCSFPLMPYW